MAARTQHAMSVLAVATALGLAACGTPTPYQPAIDGRGYAEQLLEDDRFRITFSGNALTPRETVENYLLYRAAEVTLARGFDHFVVADWDIERDTTYYSTSFGLGSTFGYGWHGVYDRPFGDFATAVARPADRYKAYANIVLGKGAKPADGSDAYDARSVLRRLADTVTLPAS